MVAEISSGKPYEEFNLVNGDRLRVFNNTPEEDLVWHRDKEDRWVYVEDNIGWKLQLDDELPILLEVGKMYVIPEMTYHRLIKDESVLVIRIKKI